MQEELKNYIINLDKTIMWKFKNLNKLENIEKIYELFINNNENILNEEIKYNSFDLQYIGVYFYIKKDYDNTEKYYLKAIENNNISAMNSLGILYRKLENYEKAKEYFFMAIENNSISAINNLGILYYELEDYDNAKKYYLKAIENNHINAMNNLGCLYSKLEDYKNMLKYYILYLENINIIQENIINSIKNILNKNNNENLIPLILKCIELLNIHNYDIPLYLKIIYKLLHTKIDLMRLHFEYSMQGKGYQEAHDDFISKIDKF